MDPGLLLLFVYIIIVCLPGAARCSNGDNNNCPCPDIPIQKLTVRPPRGCYPINSTFRYKCNDGYVRKAGTSNLIRCNMNGNVPMWSTCSLICIADPKRSTTQPPKTTVTKEHTDTPHDFIFTTTVRPSTRQQITYSANISASVTAKTESTEPTSSGPVQWTLSDHTQGKTLKVTHESVTVTRAATWTTSTSTLSLSTVKSNITLINEPRTGLNSTTAVVISFVSIVIIFAVIGISLLCYRRRLINNMPPQTKAETIPMNRELSSVLVA